MSDAPRPETSKAPPTPFVDGVIVSINLSYKKSSANPRKQKSNALNENTSQAVSNCINTFEVNVVQSTMVEKASKGKKKGKGKNQAEQPKQDSPKPPPEEGANASLSILTLSVTRITTPKTSRGGLKLVVC